MTLPTILMIASLTLLFACGRDVPEKAAPEPVEMVRTAPVTLEMSKDDLALFGSAEAGPGGTHAMSVQSEARLRQIIAPNETAVRAGQIVAILGPNAAARFDAVKAVSEGDVANSALARATRLRADGLVGDAVLEIARVAATSANTKRASVTERNSRSTLRAPASGTVQNMTARVGHQVAASLDRIRPSLGSACDDLPRNPRASPYFGAGFTEGYPCLVTLV